jgi:hypothetical protein
MTVTSSKAQSFGTNEYWIHRFKKPFLGSGYMPAFGVLCYPMSMLSEGVLPKGRGGGLQILRIAANTLHC